MLVRQTYVIISLVLFFAQALLASQAAPQKSKEEIDVTADSLSVEEKGAQIQGKGNVELRREEMILKADELRVNRETKDMDAKGNVSVDDPEWKLKRADRMQFNLDRETGEIEKGEVFIESGHLSITGQRFQKFEGQSYHVDQGFFTTCICESGPPSWKISADEIDVRRDGEGVVRRGVFYIMDVPVLYIPYGVFPIMTERQTGFLFPKFGYTNRDGFIFQQPFFWAVSKSTDVTLGFDVESRSRIGALGELRTILSRDTQAQINLSYFNESWRNSRGVKDPTIADPTIPLQRWSVIANHRQTPPSGWQSYSDIAVFSDDLFTRELNHTFNLSEASDLRSKERDFKVGRYSPSRLGFFRGWEDMSLRVEGDYYQDFIQEDRRTFQRAPQVLFTGRKLLWDTPIELRWRAEGVSYIRSEGADGLRFDLRPEFVLPYQLGPLRGSFNAAPRETVYYLYSTAGPGSFDRGKSRTLAELSWNVGTSIGRVFDFGGAELRKIKHTIEPELRYLFIPGVSQSGIPLMDGIDRINRRNVATFSLTNRFWGKFAQPSALAEDRDVEMLTTGSDVRELGWLKLALSYDIDKAKKGGDPLSDLDLSLRATPMDFIAVGLEGGLNPGPWQWTQAAVLFSFRDPRPLTLRTLDGDFMQPNSLNLTYRFIRKNPFGFFSEDANIDLNSPADCVNHPLDPRPVAGCTGFTKDVLSQLSGNFLYHATDHILLFFNASYNLRDRRFTDLRAAVKLLSMCECWTITFTLKQEINPSRTGFNVDFNLLGLGSQNKGKFNR